MNGDYQLGQTVKNKANRKGKIVQIYHALTEGAWVLSSTKYVVKWEDGTESEPLQKTELEEA